MVEGRAEGVVSRAGLRGIKGIKRDFAGLSGEGVGSGGFFRDFVGSSGRG